MQRLNCIWNTTNPSTSIQTRSYGYQISKMYNHTAIPAFKYQMIVISSIHIICHFFGVSYRNVSSVSVETFANVSALEWLDLSYNKLNSADINISRALPKMSKMYLDRYPLHCDCQLQDVWRWCQDHVKRKSSGEMTSEWDTPRSVCHIYVLV